MALTPTFPGHRRMGMLNNNNTSTSSPTGSHSSDAMMEEESSSSVLSSPPRSATPRSRLNLFFEHLNNSTSSSPDGNDHDDNFATTRNRRLFADEEDEEVAEGMPATTAAAAASSDDYTLSKNNHHVRGNNAAIRGATDRLTPHKGRRPRRKPLTIDTGGGSGGLFGSGGSSNHSMGNGSSEDSLSSSPSDNHPSSKTTTTSYPRKRSSNDDEMHTSPHVSPNSLAFMTMDGRFVQSKNPFSSPMMTEESEQILHHMHPAVQANAPTLPQEEEDDDEDQDAHNRRSALSPPPQHSPPPPNSPSKNMAGFLAPRHAKSPPLGPASAAAAAIAATPLFGSTTQPPSYGGGTASFLNGGFPDKRYSFTGSPIPEQQSQSQSPFLYNNHNNNLPASKSTESSPDNMSHATDAMETDTIHSRDNSWEGFSKVRRLHKQHDDISKASTYQARSSLGRTSVGSALTVDTTLDDAASMDNSTGSSNGGAYGNNHYLHSSNNNKNNNPEEHDDISPTDVLSFPFSPAAAKNNSSSPYPTKNSAAQQYYPSVRKKAAHPPVPPTPVAERRRQATQAARTAQSSYRPQKRDTKAHPTSRFYGDFDVISQLGNGAFGTVYKVLSRLDGCMYAIKAAKRKAKGPADRDRMLKEVYALAALSDQADTATFHIVRYHQAWMEEDRLYIQTEICQGNLEEEMAKNLVTVPRRYKLMREICLALEFLHRHSMVHLDIKPANIFVKNDQFKLGDFGLVTKISCHEDVEEGDSRYMSSELLAGDHGDLTKSDIFSLGATIYEICLGRALPLNGPEWQNIRHGQLEPLPGSDPEIVAMVQEMMHPEYRQRPTPSDLLKRPQLLSDEQKALMAERTKVAELQKFQMNHNQHHHGPLGVLKSPPVPMRNKLTRASTWNGSSFNPYI